MTADTYLSPATSGLTMKREQVALFQPQAMPAGFCYAPDLIDAAEEATLRPRLPICRSRSLSFTAFSASAASRRSASATISTAAA
jgi:hypothetical protein